MQENIDKADYVMHRLQHEQMQRQFGSTGTAAGAAAKLSKKQSRLQSHSIGIYQGIYIVHRLCAFRPMKVLASSYVSWDALTECYLQQSTE